MSNPQNAKWKSTKAVIRTYSVTVKMLREYSATIAIRARSQAAADRVAITAFYKRDWASGIAEVALCRPPH